MSDEARAEANALVEKIEAAKQGAADTSLKEHFDGGKLGKVNLKTRSTLKGHQAKVVHMQWAREGTQLLSASQDGNMVVWDGQTSNKLHAIQLRSIWVMSCSYSPNSNLVCSGGLDNILSVFNLNSANPSSPVAELQGHEGVLTGCKFITDSQIVTSSGDTTARIWDIESQKTVNEFWGHQGGVSCVMPAPDGNTFVTGSCDANAMLWDVRTGKHVCTFRSPKGDENVNHDVNVVTWHPSGNSFGTGSEDASCRLWDVRAQQSLQEYTHENINTACAGLAYSQSGRLMFSGYHNGVCEIWDTLTATLVGGLVGHEGRVACVGVAPQGLAVATASWDNTLRVWA